MCLRLCLFVFVCVNVNDCVGVCVCVGGCVSCFRVSLHDWLCVSVSLYV